MIICPYLGRQVSVASFEESKTYVEDFDKKKLKDGSVVMLQSPVRIQVQVIYLFSSLSSTCDCDSSKDPFEFSANVGKSVSHQNLQVFVQECARAWTHLSKDSNLKSLFALPKQLPKLPKEKPSSLLTARRSFVLDDKEPDLGRPEFEQLLKSFRTAAFDYLTQVMEFKHSTPGLKFLIDKPLRMLLKQELIQVEDQKELKSELKARIQVSVYGDFIKKSISLQIRVLSCLKAKETLAKDVAESLAKKLAEVCPKPALELVSSKTSSLPSTKM